MENGVKVFVLFFLVGAMGVEGFWSRTNNNLFPTNIGDDVNVTGNITAANVFLPSHLFVHTDRTISMRVSGQWENVTFDDNDIDLKARINHTSQASGNDTVTFVDEGIYELTYALDFIDSAPNPVSDTAVRFLRNDVEINGSVFESDANRQNAEYEISNVIHAKFNSTDTLKIQFTSDETTVSMSSHNTFGVHPDTATMTIERFA